MRKVLFVTAIRSEYDIQYSMMRAVQDHSNLEVALVVTGAHLSPMYGLTVREVEQDGFPIVARIESLLNSDSAAGRIKSAAIQLAGLVDVFAQQRPTFVIAPMDREEAITVALAGGYLSIPVVHFGGGDYAEDGNIDNAVRHAVTKMAHMHMVGTQRSADRVVRLGEEPWRVHVVGEPGLDRLLTTPEIPLPELWHGVGHDPGDRPFAIVIQHSTISDVARAGELMSMTLDCLLGLEIPSFVSYPNSDAGSQKIIATIDDYGRKHPSLIHTYRNLPRIDFVNLMRRAHVLVGNSSCGIIEAPLLHLPVVNIGPRQRGREHTSNVQLVDHDAEQIASAIRRAVFDPDYRQSVAQCVNPYGDGHAGERIAEILFRQELGQRLVQKVNSY